MKKAHLDDPVEVRVDSTIEWGTLTTNLESDAPEDNSTKKRAWNECQEEHDEIYNGQPLKRICQRYEEVEIQYELTTNAASTSSVPRDPDSAMVSLPYEVESVSDVHLRNAILLRTSPRYILFSSLQSLTISITALTSDTSASDLPLDINLSRLRTRCREKSIKEGLMKTLVLKGEVAVTDLTEEVKVVGEHPEWYGSFADIWKGEWDERGVFGGGMKRAVSIFLGETTSILHSSDFLRV